MSVHRAVCEAIYGPPPTSPDGSRVEVMHSCDNPPCFNPAHLRWGTQLENAADRVAKGRSATDACTNRSRGNRRVDDDQVRDIRRRYVAGRRGRPAADGSGRGNAAELAVEFGLSERAIRDIGRRITFSDLPT